MTAIFILLVLYQIKHFVADYPLQTPYMLGKFKSGTEWILPLLAHVGVHGAMTAFICLFFKPELAIPLTLFDMTVHFIMDRIKASPALLGRFQALNKDSYISAQRMKAGLDGLDQTNNTILINLGKKQLKSNVYFWWSLGLDQGVHHLTHYAIIWWLVS